MTHLFPAAELNQALLAACRHPNPNIRAAAAIALGRVGDVDFLDPLVRLLSDPIHSVRRRAVEGIGMLGAPVVGALLAYLEEYQDSGTQQRLSEALSRIRDPEAVEILSASVNYLSPPGRIGAIEALGEIGDARAVPALTQAARSDHSLSRQKAAQALLQIGAPQAVIALSAMLDDADPRLRQLAVSGLGTLGGEQSILSLLPMLNDDEESVRHATAAALKRINDPEALDVFLTAMNNQSTWVQQTIADVLGGYPGEDVAERLHRLLAEQGDLQSRMIAAQALARIGDSRGTALIKRTLNAPNSETRRQAAIALGRSGDPDAIPHLLEAFRLKPIDASTPAGRNLRRQLIEGACAVGAPIVPSLITLLADTDPVVQKIAQDALLQLGTEVVPQLIEAVENHRVMAVRVQAARLLGNIGDARAVDALSAVLRSALIGPYPVVFFTRLFWDRTAVLRAAAAASLGQIGVLDGASILLSSVRFDPDNAVKSAAEHSLGSIGSPQVTARFAGIDVAGTVNRILTSAILLLLVGFLAGLVSQAWGVRDATLLVGLAAGGMLGAVDGFQGRKRTGQGALAGGLLALMVSWGTSSMREPWMFSVAAGIFPPFGGLLGWRHIQLTERLAGFFGGMVLGFLGSGLAILVLGTIG